MKIRLFGFFLLVLVMGGCAQQEPVKKVEEMFFSTTGQRIDTAEEVLKTGKLYEIVTQEVTYIENNLKVKGFLVQPDFIGNSPALIVVPEWWGLNDAVKEKAKGLAKQGYTVLVIDLYDGEVTDDPVKARELAQGVQSNLEKAHENLFWAEGYLRQMIRVDLEKIFLTGWCFGEANAPDADGTAAWSEGRQCGNGEARFL